MPRPRGCWKVPAWTSLLDFATEMPLHALLARMDCHLTVSLSTVVTEAAVQGVPSVACGSEASEFFRSEVDGGMLVVAAERPRRSSAGLRHLLGTGRRPPLPARSRARDVLARLLAGENPGPDPVTPLRAG